MAHCECCAQPPCAPDVKAICCGIYAFSMSGDIAVDSSTSDSLQFFLTADSRWLHSELVGATIITVYGNEFPEPPANSYAVDQCWRNLHLRWGVDGEDEWYDAQVSLNEETGECSLVETASFDLEADPNTWPDGDHLYDSVLSDPVPIEWRIRLFPSAGCYFKGWPRMLNDNTIDTVTITDDDPWEWPDVPSSNGLCFPDGTLWREHADNLIEQEDPIVIWDPLPAPDPSMSEGMANSIILRKYSCLKDFVPNDSEADPGYGGPYASNNNGYPAFPWEPDP